MNVVKRTLAFRLFAILFLANVVILGLAVGLFSHNLDQRFDQYLRADTEQRMLSLANDLGDWFEVQGSFDALVSNPWLWRQWQGRDLFGTADTPDPLRQTPLSLLDARGRLLVGPEVTTPLRTDPIWAHGVVVGALVLGAALPEQNRGVLEQNFAAQYGQLLLYFAAFLFLSALLIAAWVARRLNSTLRAFGQAIHGLAHNQFTVNLPPQRTIELDRLANDIRQLGAALERHSVSQERWLADIAHELRTPVTILQGELEAIKDGVRAADADNMASLMSETSRLARLIEDLRKLTLIDRGAHPLVLERVDVSSLLQECLERHRTVWLAQGLHLQQNIVAAVFAQLDAGRFMQCLDNLAANSARYTTAPGQLRVSLQRRSDTSRQLCCITWEDSAPGVSHADLPHLGERLFRPDQSRSRSTGGSGLGLSIAMGLARLQGIRMTASASTLGGLAWTLELTCEPV